jgi:hypothetical protein
VAVVTCVPRIYTYMYIHIHTHTHTHTHTHIISSCARVAVAVVICVRRVLGGQVGIANQTTMYKEETAAIAKLFERTMLRKHGPQEGPNRFMSLDTICDATQARRTSAHMRTHTRSGPDRFMPSTPTPKHSTVELEGLPDIRWTIRAILRYGGP